MCGIIEIYYMDKYKVEVKNNGGDDFIAQSENGEFVINTSEKSVSPLEALLAALGSCTGYYVRLFAETKNISLKPFSINLESELIKEKSFYFKDIIVNIQLGENEFDEHTKSALFAFIKNCPVHSTLKGNPNIEIRIV